MVSPWAFTSCTVAEIPVRLEPALACVDGFIAVLAPAPASADGFIPVPVPRAEALNVGSGCLGQLLLSKLWAVSRVSLGTSRTKDLPSGCSLRASQATA